MSAQPWELRLAHLQGAFTQFGERLNSIDLRLDTLDRKIDQRSDALDHKFDQRFDALDSKIDQRFDAEDHKFDQRFDALDGKSGQRFMWIIGVVFGTWLTTILSIFLHHSG